MTWIHRLNTPSVLNKVSIFNYDRTPEVYPQYRAATPISLNENVFTNFESITVDGETIPVRIDFSGIGMGIRRLGDGGANNCNFNMNGGVGFDYCQSLPWPRCSAQYSYSKLSEQSACSAPGIFNCEPYDFGDCLENSSFGSDGLPGFPTRIISPNDIDKAEYWNDLNLWYNSVYAYSGSILIKNDGPSYEEGGEEYILKLGHPIGTPNSNFTISFFDSETNQLIYREFESACTAFGENTEGIDCNEYNTNPNVTASVFATDGWGLYVMKKNQDPIPNNIKRYKILMGKVKENFSTYGIDGNGIVTKTIIKKINGKLTGVPDRNLPETYGFGPVSYLRMNSPWIWNYIRLTGQGDDGGCILTTTLDGESILCSFDPNQIHGSVVKNSGNPITGLGRCNGIDDLFILNDETKTVDINTWCMPNLYHPEETIPNYPDFDNVELFTLPRNVYKENIILRYNNRLNELNKPKIVTYDFGSYVIEETLNLPNVTQEPEFNFPLKNYPYLSRESSNSTYQNANLIDFQEQKMLQASELNELQEKFYRKQSLFVEYNKNWLSKQFLTSTNKDILGTSFIDNLYGGSSNINKIIPISKNLISISTRTENGVLKYELILNDGWYLLNSKFKGIKKVPNTAEEYNLVSNTTNYYDLNFIKLESDFYLFNYSDATSITSEEYFIITLNVDMTNVITCNEYSDLKDNSNGVSSNAPCGANRNILYQMNFEKLTLPKNGINELYPNSLGPNIPFVETGRNLTPVNSLVARELGAPHIVAYAKREQNVVNLYLANGVLLYTFQLI